MSFCPNCICTAAIKRGFDKHGNQIYQCKKCGRYYQNEYHKKTSLNIEEKFLHCPNCGSVRKVKAGFNRKGCQTYHCKNCNTEYMSPENYSYNTEYSQIEKVECIYCGGKTRKEGFTKIGSQKYYCTVCKKHFIQGEKLRKYSKLPVDVIKKTKMYLQVEGLYQRDIAKMLGISRNSVIKINAELKKAG